MEESCIYQVAEDYGARVAMRRILLQCSAKRLGPPDAAIVAYLEAIDENEELEQLVDASWDATSWSELLVLPTALVGPPLPA